MLRECPFFLVTLGAAVPFCETWNSLPGGAKMAFSFALGLVAGIVVAALAVGALD